VYRTREQGSQQRWQSFPLQCR